MTVRKACVLSRCVTAASVTAAAALTADAYGQDCLSLQAAPFAGLIGVNRPVGLIPVPDMLDAVVHDFDGTGPQQPRLVVTGHFLHIGGVFARGVAAFDGERWMPLGPGLNFTPGGTSSRLGGNSLAIHRGELYIGGSFTSTTSGTLLADDRHLPSLARWNGMTFEPAYRAATGPGLQSGGTIFSLASAHGMLYFAGSPLTYQNVAGVGTISNGGRLTESGLLRLPTAHGFIVSIMRVGDEVFYGPALTDEGEEGVIGWNGTNARVLSPYPAASSEKLFPFCAVEDNGTIIFGGDIAPTTNETPPTYGTLRWSGVWSNVPNMPLPSGGSFARVSSVDSFSKRDGNIFAFTWPNDTTRSPMQRLVNGQWVDEPVHYTGFNRTNNHIRGEVRFGDRRFIYGKISTQSDSTSTPRVTLPDPASLIAEVDANNRVIPMSGIYNAYPSSGSNDRPPTTHRPVVQVGNQLIMGGPTGFVFGGSRVLYVAGWDGSRWSRVANNDLANAPIDLAWHNNELYALSRVAPSNQTNWQLLRRDASQNWTTAAAPLFTGEAQLIAHQGELYLFLHSSQNGSDVHRLSSPTTLTPAPLFDSSFARRLAVSVGTDLYCSNGTTLRRLTGTAWQTVSLVGGPSNVNVIFAHAGALHAVDSTGSGATLTIRLHRLNGSTWTLVSSTPITVATTPFGADVIDGDIYIAGSQSVLKYATDGTWREYVWPFVPPFAYSSGNSPSSSGGGRFTTIKDAAGRILVRGAFEGVGVDPAMNIAVLAPTPIRVDWPPLPRAGTRNSIISIGVGATGQQSTDTGLTYQWLRNGQPLINGTTPAGTVIAGATARRLVLSNSKSEDAGMYSVRISLACSTSVTTDPVPITISACNDVDFNNNGVFVEDQDVTDFFNVLAGQECLACDDIDFNNNDVFPEDQDVIDFFNVLAGGPCSTN
ncbi:MAG TPA: immunoglobulin domain-containing protein [Phycisphaerales bacterium]|nr:immunoglobulin domain-containing protein [Phycisphaerales bacterium]